jgi:hypothetical protein
MLEEEKAMFKSLRSERGGTLMLVFGFIVMISLILVPLAMSTNIGLLQAKTNGNTEAAFNEAQSAMTVFGRLYEDMTGPEGADSPNNTEAKIMALVDEVNRIPGLDAEAVIIRKNDEPVAVAFTARHGVSNQVRAATVKYRLASMYVAPSATPEVAPPTSAPTSPPGPTPTPIPPGIGTGLKVIINDSKYNPVFAACYAGVQAGSQLPSEHIRNDAVNFNELFDPVANYNLNSIDPLISRYTNMIYGYDFPGVFADARYTAANQGNPTGAAGDITVQAPSSTTVGAISQAGNVSIYTNSETATSVTISKDINGKSVVAGGNLKLWSEKNGAGTIVFQGDVYVKGNLEIAGNMTVNEVVFEGDVVIGGNLIINKSFNKLTFNKDLLVNNFAVNVQMTGLLKVSGMLAAKGDMSFSQMSSTSLFEVGLSGRGDTVVGGKVTFSQTIDGSIYIHNDWAAGQTFLISGTFNPSSKFTVGGNLLSGTEINFQSNINIKLSIGKSVISKGKISFGQINTSGSVEIGGNLLAETTIGYSNNIDGPFKVGQSMFAKDGISFGLINSSKGTVEVTEHIISGTTITFKNIDGVLQTGKSLVSKGALTFSQINSNPGLVDIGENILSASTITFSQNIDGVVKVGKSFAAASDINFGIIQNAKGLAIGENLITKGNLIFRDKISKPIKLANGALIVYGNATMGNTSDNLNWELFQAKGFFVKGTTNINLQNVNNGRKLFCIT